MNKKKQNINKTTFRMPMAFTIISILFTVFYLTVIVDLERYSGIKSYLKYYADDAVTLGFILIMILILWFDAICSRKKLNRLTEELFNTTQKIKEKKDIFATINTNNNGVLNECLEEYRKKILSGNGVHPDISDFINEQIIADKTHQAISNQISNAMTGLGILGTFVGLVIGLEGFDVSRLNEISILINGIKTAFYTSIFGVIASILYNYDYHKSLENNNNALEEFYDYFYDTVSINPDIEFYNKMIKHNENEADSIAKAITPLFGDLITRSITPVMNKLSNSLDEYIIDAVEAQSSTLQKLVDNFMTQLNKSMDDQFYSLSHSIRDMCTWQNESVEKTKTILENINGVIETLSLLNSDIKETETIRNETNKNTSELISQTKAYVDEFKTYSEELKAWSLELKNETEKNAECSKVIREFSETQNKGIENIINQFEGIISQFEKYKEETENVLSAHRSDNTNLLNTISSITKQFDKYVEENNTGMARNISANEQAMNKLMTYNNNLIESTEVISGQIATMEENMRDIINEMRTVYKNQDNLLSKTVENLSNERVSVNNISGIIEKTVNQGMSNIIDSNNKIVTEKILPAINKINQRGNEK